MLAAFCSRGALRALDPTLGQLAWLDEPRAKWGATNLHSVARWWTSVDTRLQLNRGAKPARLP